MVNPRLPEKMKPVRSVVEGCAVRFEWEIVVSDEEIILSYQVKLRGKSGRLYLLKDCGQDPLTPNCTISFATLTKEPFLLHPGDYISDRVTVQAINFVGVGEASEFNAASL